jgi:hypothetical protein
MFETPILLIIFNRPDETERVFNVIRKQKPRQFFVAADGPRAGVVEDITKCKAAREKIKVTWECDFQSLYHEENLGCGLGPSDAISWFFSHVDKGIILEDDCMPHADFFQYCSDLLNLYELNEKIFFIGGTNFQKGKLRGKASYYFSAGNQGTWGWATWKRSWEEFNYFLSDIEEDKFKDTILQYFHNRHQINYWINIFREVKRSQLNNSCWDYQFYFSGWMKGKFAIIPNKNLVTNIGFGDSSTHKFDLNSNLINQETYPILPLHHPSTIELNRKADFYLHKKFIQPYEFGIKRIFRILYKLRKFLKGCFSKKK